MSIRHKPVRTPSLVEGYPEGYAKSLKLVEQLTLEEALMKARAYYRVKQHEFFKEKCRDNSAYNTRYLG